ncbi:MAG TPA: 50S ribosomal protein L18 [Saprospiraceae bacterium]|nr:50S ribosomal protein L18 [Saprospiraceae bacterium]MCB9329208.1 50S ribosomal protein L18 [Lewinellaceae bacterium]HPQ21551.1 50S ribosomal protein L18 [Saprospiraceae bacterium]
MKSTYNNRKKIKLRIRNKISGTSGVPRLSVFRSNKAIYCQLIDDMNGVTMASASSKEVADRFANVEIAGKVGELIADRAKSFNIESVKFDRNGYLYHGKVKSLADGARKGGLNF